MIRKPVWRHLCLLLLTAVVLAAGVCLFRVGYRRYFRKVYPLEHEALVEAASEEFDIPASLIYAIIHTESSFEEDATSHAQAKGLMQLTDDTFQWALMRAGETGKYTTDALYDPQVNIHYGVYVLKLLGEQFPDMQTVLAAYNAGQGRVKEWLKDPAYSADGEHLDAIPYAETAEYVRRVEKARQRYRQLYRLDD